MGAIAGWVSTARNGDEDRADFATISEVIRAARSRLSQGLWDHSAGGVGTVCAAAPSGTAAITAAIKRRCRSTKKAGRNVSRPSP